MNIVAILANGVGARFGSNIPKQFHRINGKMVIEYVVESILEAKTVDRIVIVTNVEENKSYLTNLALNDRIDFVNGGKTRNYSLVNALSYIHDNYSCKKLIVCDAVRPMITCELIDKYFGFLDNNAAVVTAQQITDSLGCYDIPHIYRDRYYLMQSPEGFDFELLYNSFDPESKLTEVTQQLPEGSPIELYFDFNNNYKLTYPADLKYLEALINARDNGVDYSAVFDRVRRLNRYLYENYPSETKSWMKRLHEEIPSLLQKWQITDYQVVKTSHFGIIFLASSVNYGNCVIKIIPPFIGRYEPEKSCYQHLPASFMCELYDFDDSCSAILLYQMEGDIDRFDSNNKKLFEFFKNAILGYKTLELSKDVKATFSDYRSVLQNKLDDKGFTYRYDEIMGHVKKANELYESVFSSDECHLVHGDLHRYNIMKTGGNIVAIDPIGYIAPVELDIARFIGTELTDANKDKQALKDELIEYFAPLSSKEKVEAMLYIDIAFRLHNSIFENDSFELTDKWLDILNNIF